MRHVTFTDHALDRCRQQRINPQVVTMAVLAGVPPTAGEFKWYFPEARLSVVTHYDPKREHYAVITVIGNQKMANRKKFQKRRGH